MRRVPNDHVQVVKRQDIARPRDAPGEVDHRVPRDLDDPLLVFEPLGQPAHRELEAEAIVGGAPFDEAALQQGLKKPVHRAAGNLRVPR